MNLISVLFWDGSSSSYFSRKLFEFGAYANSLLFMWIAVMVYWQYFIISFLFQRADFSSQQWRQLLEFALVLFLLTIWISDYLCLAHIATRNQDECTVSFISRRKFISLFFEEAVRIWSLCKFSLSFGLQSWYNGSIL